MLLVLLCLVLFACSPANRAWPGRRQTPRRPKTATPRQMAGPRPQLTSKELNLYAWSEYVPQALLDGFQKEYGVKVNYDTYSSNEELVAKLQAGASGYDVIIPSDYMVTILAKQGLLEDWINARSPTSQYRSPGSWTWHMTLATNTLSHTSGARLAWSSNRAK